MTIQVDDFIDQPMVCPSCGLDMDVQITDGNIYFLHAEPPCEWLVTADAREWLQSIVERATAVTAVEPS